MRTAICPIVVRGNEFGFDSSAHRREGFAAAVAGFAELARGELADDSPRRNLPLLGQ